VLCGFQDKKEQRPKWYPFILCPICMISFAIKTFRRYSFRTVQQMFLSLYRIRWQKESNVHLFLVYFSLSPFLMGFLLNSFVNFVFFLVMTLAGHRRKSLSSCVSPFMLCLVELFFLACYQFMFLMHTCPLNNNIL
jgi:hypothetical protein